MAGRSIFKISIGFSFGLLILALLTQCSTKPGVLVKEDESQLLKSRAKQYWDLLVNINPKNAEKSYLYEAPFFREKVSFGEYINRFKLIRYLEADIAAIEIEGKKGKVTVTSGYQMILPQINKKKLTRTDVENWVKVEGAWYHIPREWVIPES